MSGYKHILAAIEFDESSTTVLQSAAAMAQLCQADLTVVHVVRNPVVIEMDIEAPTIYELESKLVELAQKQLQSLLAKSVSASNVRSIVTAGRPKDEIISIAEKEKVDLIVVGAHGRHGLSKLLGSTANRVLTHAACDVLVVR
jgi:universal stress protein A